MTNIVKHALLLTMIGLGSTGAGQTLTYKSVTSEPPKFGGKLLAALPIEIVHGIPAVRITLNNKKGQLFLLDSGSVSLIDKAEAVSLGMTLSPVKQTAITLRGTGYTQLANPLSAQTLCMDLGKKLRIKGDLLAIDLSPLSRELGIDVKGVLGFDIIRQYPTLIDYPNASVRFFEAKSLRHSEEASAISFAIDPKALTPIIGARVCVGNSKCGDARVIIDTGNQASALIYDRLAAELRLKSLSGWREQLVLGYAGKIDTLTGLQGQLTVGHRVIELSGIELVLHDDAHDSTDTFDISLGSGALLKGDVLFDISHGLIMLTDISR